MRICDLPFVNIDEVTNGYGIRSQVPRRTPNENVV